VQNNNYFFISNYDSVLISHPYLQGKDLSSNNITDIYALLNILRSMKSDGACIIKHNNPCGVALDKDILKVATTKRGGALSGRYEICVWQLRPGALDEN